MTQNSLLARAGVQSRDGPPRGIRVFHFHLLRCLEAPEIFYFIIVIVILGRFASLFFTAVFSRGKPTASYLLKPKEKLPEKEQPENGR